MKNLTTNTLVYHKRNKNWGIGCIADVMSKHYKVNFGTDDVKKVTFSMVEPIDTSKCRTIKYSDFRRMTITNTVTEKIIIGNELKEYVGIGWLTLRVIKPEDLEKYARLID